MLVQIHEKASQPIKDPCSSITCGALKCPAGFTKTLFDGHCCEYCYNPDIKIEALVKGAEGTQTTVELPMPKFPGEAVIGPESGLGS